MTAAVALGTAASAHESGVPPSPARFEPVGREARIELGLRNDFAMTDEAVRYFVELLLGITEPRDYDYYAADLILPASTTAELARFIRKHGASKGARWFCSTYAEPPIDAPDFPTLRTALVLAAAQSPLGARATDAVVCRERVRRPKPAVGVAVLGQVIASAVERALGHAGTMISSAACVGTDAMREAFDTGTCENLLLSSRYTMRVFKRTTLRAARHHGCLRLRAAAHRDSVDTADLFSFFEVSGLAPCS